MSGYELATAYVNIVASAKGLGADITRLLGQTEGQAGQAGARAGSTMAAKLGKTLKVGVLGAGAAAVGVLATSLTKGFGRLTNIENATAKLGGLGHSAAEVSTIMGDALASVKGTAFGLDDAATVAATAVAAGIAPGKELQKTLGLVGDAATIGGTSLTEMGAIFNKVAASNKVQGDVINQLNDKGIPIIQLLGKTMGKTSAEVTDLAAKGKIDFATFQKSMAAGLGGAALKSGDTTVGALANMNAAMGRFGASLLKGVFPIAKTVFGGIGGLFDKMTKAATPFAAMLSTKLTAGVAKLGPIFSTLGKDISGSLNVLKTGGFDPKKFAPGIEEGSPFVRGLLAIHDGAIKVGAAVGGAFSSAWKSIAPVLSTVGIAVGGVLLSAFHSIAPILAQVGQILGPAIATVFSTLAPIFGQLVGALAPVLPILSPFSLIFHALLPIMPQIAAVLAQVAGIVAGALAQAFAAVQPLIITIVGVFSQLLPIVTTLISSLLPPMVALFQAIAPALEIVLAALLPVVTTIANALIPIVNALLPVVRTVFAFVAATITNAMAVVQGVINVVTGIISGNWTKVWTGMKMIVGALWAQIKTTITSALAVIQGVLNAAWAAIRGGVQTAWSAIKSYLGGIWSGITGVVTGAARGLASFLWNIWSGIRSAATSAWSTIRNAISGAWSAISGVVRGAASGISSFLSGVWNGIRGAASGAWNAVKSAIIAPLQSAYSWITGVFGSIGGYFNSLWSGIVSGARSILGGIGGAVSGAFSGIASVIRAPINAVIGAVNRAISGINSISVDLPSFLGGGHVGFSIGHIPSLAKGGVMEPTAGGTLVRVAEAGQREIVTPEPLMRSVVDEALARQGAQQQRTGPLIGAVYQQPGQSPWQLAADLDRRMAFLGRD